VTSVETLRDEADRAIRAAPFGVARAEAMARQIALTEALCRLRQDRPAEALPLLERSLALGEAAPQEPRVQAQARFRVAQALWALHRDDARARRLALAAATFIALPKPQWDYLHDIDAALAKHPPR
jgi:hypothetical protein